MGRVREHRISRRVAAAQGRKESGEEGRRGDAQRAARRGGVRARRGWALREGGGPGGLPQRPLRQKAPHRGRGGRAQRAEALRGDLPDGRHRDTTSMSAYLLAVLRLAWGFRAISSFEAASASIGRMLRLCPGNTAILIKLLNCSCSQCSFLGNHSNHFLVNINIAARFVLVDHKALLDRLRPDHSAPALALILARFDNEAIWVALECIAGQVCSWGAMGDGTVHGNAVFSSRSFDEEATRSCYTLRRRSSRRAPVPFNHSLANHDFTFCDVAWQEPVGVDVHPIR